MKRLEGRQVDHLDPQQVFYRAGDVVAFDDLWRARD
jgi:hypothetical protein